MQFNYVATTAENTVVKGHLSARSEKEARFNLQSQNLTPVLLKVKRRAILDLQVPLGRVSYTELLFFSKHLGIMLGAGISLLEALEMLKKQSKGRLAYVLKGVVDDVSGGSNLSDALAKYPKDFPDLIVRLIASGELSATLEENLKYISEFLKKDVSLRKKVKGAMMYPVIVFIAVLGLTMVIGLFVMPQILPLFTSLSVKLPWSTKLLIWAAELFQDYGLFIILGMILSGVFTPIILELTFVRPLSHNLYVRLPLVGRMVREIYLARFFRVFATLLQAGITIDRALEVTHHIIYNHAYKACIENMKHRVVRGDVLSDAIQGKNLLFPPMSVHMLKVGERSGNFSDSLEYLGKYYEEEVDNKLKNLSTLIEPILLVMIGLVVGGVALSIIGPIYSLSGGIS